MLLLFVLCVYVLCTVVGSWMATSHEFEFLATPALPKQVLKGKQWSNQSVSEIKSKLIAAGERSTQLPNLRLLALCNVTNFNIFFL